jgi:hypothetical protein
VTLRQSKGEGATDPANKSSKSSMTISQAGKPTDYQQLMVGNDLYLKMKVDLPGIDPNKWMHLDISKSETLKKLGLGDAADPTNTKSLPEAIVTAQKAGDDRYTGTMDVTKRLNSSALTGELAKQMGDAAKKVPFEVTLKDGYPTAVTISMPAAGEVPKSTTKLTFTDFGRPVAIAKPATTEIQEAPSALTGN